MLHQLACLSTCPRVKQATAALPISSPVQDAEDLEEAGAEVMLLDDETVPYVVGECLVHLPREEVEERLQAGARGREGGGTDGLEASVVGDTGSRHGMRMEERLPAGECLRGSGGGWQVGSRVFLASPPHPRPPIPPPPPPPPPPPLSLRAALDEIQEETKGIEGQMRGIKAQMQELKAQLYARFGSSINLEE